MSFNPKVSLRYGLSYYCKLLVHTLTNYNFLQCEFFYYIDPKILMQMVLSKLLLNSFNCDAKNSKAMIIKSCEQRHDSDYRVYVHHYAEKLVFTNNNDILRKFIKLYHGYVASHILSLKFLDLITK